MAPAPVSTVDGRDGRPRCPWALAAPEYVAYHDDEWGRSVVTVTGLFERLSLEAFQSGLSWLTILRKRDGFRRAFAGFDPVRVATFDEGDVARLMADPQIVRNRAKVAATIANARVVAGMGQGFAELLLSFRQPVRSRPATLAEVPALTPASTAMAKALKARGLRFVGPTTAYALMQATGLIDDHLAGCFVTPSD